MTHILTISFNDMVLAATGMSRSKFSKTAQFTIAAKLYVDGKLSAGQVAEFCNMSKIEFLYELPRNGFAMSNITPEDLEDDLEFAFSTYKPPIQK